MRKAAIALSLVAAVAVAGCQTITEVMPSETQDTNSPTSSNPIPVVVVPVPIPTAVPATPPPAAPNPNTPPVTGTPTDENPGNGGNAPNDGGECFGRQVDYPPAPVGCRIHMDVTPTDSRNQHTQARGTPRWTYSNTSIIGISGNSPYNPVLDARDTGDLQAYAEVDGVRSNVVGISIR
jgi:hypothetical protein